jgi:hypothetical protein
VLEWVFLFHSKLAVSDEELPGIVAELGSVGAAEAAAGEEGER